MGMIYIQKIVLILFELSTIYIAVNHFLKQKDIQKIKKILVIIVFFIIMIFNSLVGNVIIKLVCSLTLLTLITNYLYKGKLVSKIAIVFLIMKKKNMMRARKNFHL